MNTFDLYIFPHVCYTIIKSLKISGVLGLGIEIIAMYGFFLVSSNPAVLHEF